MKISEKSVEIFGKIWKNFKKKFVSYLTYKLPNFLMKLPLLRDYLYRAQRVRYNIIFQPSAFRFF